MFHPATAGKYRLPRKKAVLMEGPPGNGKTKVARATCDWLAGMSAQRPLPLHQREARRSELDVVWRHRADAIAPSFAWRAEAAAAEPSIPVVMFWDEVDSHWRQSRRERQTGSTTEC